VDAVDRAGWTSLLERFDERSVLHAWEFPAAICPRQAVSRLVVRAGGDVAGMALVRIVALPLAGAGVAQVAAGPLWRRSGVPLRDAWRGLERTLRALHEEYVVRRGLLLRVTPRIAEDEGAEPRRILAAFGFALSERIPRYRTVVLDLDRPLDAIRDGFHRTPRKSLQAAERAGLTLRAGRGPELFAAFAPLYREVAARKGFEPSIDVARWARLAERLPDLQRPRVFLAYEGSTAVAGLVAFPEGGHGGVGWALAAAATPRGRELRAGYLVHWRAIEWLHGLGCRAYDLVGAAPDENPGTYQFKMGLGGEDVSYLGTFEACESRGSRALAGIGDPLRGAVGGAWGALRRRLGPGPGEH
jgi:hypothetical protein